VDNETDQAEDSGRFNLELDYLRRIHLTHYQALDRAAIALTHSRDPKDARTIADIATLIVAAMNGRVSMDSPIVREFLAWANQTREAARVAQQGSGRDLPVDVEDRVRRGAAALAYESALQTYSMAALFGHRVGLFRPLYSDEGWTREAEEWFRDAEEPPPGQVGQAKTKEPAPAGEEA
jgi:hypothetical protein